MLCFSLKLTSQNIVVFYLTYFQSSKYCELDCFLFMALIGLLDERINIFFVFELVFLDFYRAIDFAQVIIQSLVDNFIRCCA